MHTTESTSLERAFHRYRDMVPEPSTKENDMKSNGLVKLRVKSRSLAEEAKIIRHEKRRAKAAKRTGLVNELHGHHMGVVRPTARFTHLAIAYLRGVPYRVVERTNKPGNELRPNAHGFRFVVDMVSRHGGITRDAAYEGLSVWCKEGT